ncbi:MAG: hypothetical protein ACF8LL_03235 [Phycisphaerales bacterium]
MNFGLSGRHGRLRAVVWACASSAAGYWAGMCGGDGWSVQYDIGSEHFESIQSHIAYAELSRD